MNFPCTRKPAESAETKTEIVAERQDAWALATVKRSGERKALEKAKSKYDQAVALRDARQAYAGPDLEKHREEVRECEARDRQIGALKDALDAAQLADGRAKDAVVAARQALDAAIAAPDAPALVDTAADLPQLKEETARLQKRASDAEASNASAEAALRSETANLAAGEAEGFDTKDAALAAINSVETAAQRARQTVAAADSAKADHLAAAARVARLEVLQGVAALKARAADVLPAIQSMDLSGETIARLVRTSQAAVDLMKTINDGAASFHRSTFIPSLLIADEFVSRVRIPKLTGRAFHLNYITDPRDKYFIWLEPLDEYLKPLREFRGVTGDEIGKVFREVALAIIGRYETEAWRFVKAMAVDFGWKRDRDALFAGAVGDAARGVEKPATPLGEIRGGDYWPIWAVVDLPAVRTREMIWSSEWDPRSLLDLATREAA